VHQKVIPCEKFYIARIVADIVTKFSEFTDMTDSTYHANFIKITNVVQ